MDSYEQSVTKVVPETLEMILTEIDRLLPLAVKDVEEAVGRSRRTHLPLLLRLADVPHEAELQEMIEKLAAVAGPDSFDMVDAISLTVGDKLIEAQRRIERLRDSVELPPPAVPSGE